MRTLWLIAGLLMLPLVASGAPVYPQCGTGVPQACTVVVLVTDVSTPIFAQWPSRQYLLIDNQGYLTTAGTSP